MKLVIYKYTCPSNKSYIGITIHPEKRKEAHIKSTRSKRKRTKFSQALCEIGFDNFIYTEIEYPQTVDEMRERERYWIEYYDSLNNGYNSNLGGGWTRKFEHSAKKVEIVMKLLKEDILTQDQIAEEVNVSKSWVSQIKNGKLRNESPIERTNRQSQRGSSNKASKLTETQVTEIQSQLSQGVSRRTIQENYNISKSLVQQIAAGQIWNHVESDYKYQPRETNGNAKLTADIVRELKRDLQFMTQQAVADKYNISRATVQQIKSGKTWKEVVI